MIRRGLLPLAVLATLASGCAGGWRDGAPPGSEGAGGHVATAPGSAPSTPSAGGTRVTVEGVRFVCRMGGTSVALAGEFNQWNTTADPMARQADGSFVLLKKLEPGRYAYKFVIDGGTWKEDPSAAASVDDGLGGKNSVIEVPAGGAAPSAPAATDAPAAPGKGRPPEITSDGVRFTFAGAASSVHLAGAFNGWSVNADPLARRSDGTWTIVKKLGAGKHPYKFLVNATTWKTDEANPDSEDDGFGGKNSVVTVP